MNHTLELPLSVTTRGAYEITLETAVPKVLSITTLNGAGTTAVQYRVVFDRAVTGFDSTQDVAITSIGASEAFAGILPESATSYLLNPNNVSGSGGFIVKVDGVAVNSAENYLSAMGCTSSPVSFTLQTPVVGGGTIVRAPDSAAYPSGTVVQITPIPAEGCKLGSWSGGTTGSANPLSVAMTAAPDTFHLPAGSLAPDGHLRLTYRRNAPSATIPPISRRSRSTV